MKLDCRLPQFEILAWYISGSSGGGPAPITWTGYGSDRRSVALALGDAAELVRRELDAFAG
jgi:hypothetical protein